MLSILFGKFIHKAACLMEANIGDWTGLNKSISVMVNEAYLPNNLHLHLWR